MAANYLPYEPEQMILLPEAIQDWLPEGHLAHFISDTVDTLDLSAFHARYEKDGPRNQPFHPAMMVKVLVYGYATGVFSSRKMARKLHEDVGFRVLAAGNFPAHRTLRDFRAIHLQELSELFVQVVRLAREMGLVKLGTMAVDGTKVKANASRHKAMSYERMLQSERELRTQIDELLARAKAADEAEKRTSPRWTFRRRSPGAKHDWRRSRRRVRAWSSASARPMHSAGATRTIRTSRVARTASPRGAAMPAISGCPRTPRRRISPTRTAGL
ncbi:hypothetical protein GALL_418850 [mine drainage metagenome]|uniref:Transposase InsH N-terminal domain-containing protein n=1 Tax=mine drainage metagenome TaxID=410659 RepID=A0A1J5PZM7_9ZZZZ